MPGGSTALATPAATDAGERDQLLERLSHLRSILPAFAEEMATARREAARLRVENRELTDEVQRLRVECALSGSC